MIQFYAPDIEKTNILPECDSLHCVRVLRMKVGDTIEVIDGNSYRYNCKILEAHQKRTRVEILNKQYVPHSWNNNITIAVAPTKHLDRMEWLVEKLTEIGINRISPLLCRYSERKEIKTERLEKIAISAMKQSLKATLPQIDSMTPLKNFISDCNCSQKFIAYCDSSIPRLLFSKEYTPNKDCCILIGPEGDFSKDEITFAIENGFHPISFGDNRLRTETAALVACHTCHIINQIN